MLGRLVGKIPGGGIAFLAAIALNSGLAITLFAVPYLQKHEVMGYVDVMVGIFVFVVGCALAIRYSRYVDAG